METLTMKQPKLAELLAPYELPNRRVEAWRYTPFEELASCQLREPANNPKLDSLPYDPSPVYEDSYKVFILDFDLFFIDPELSDFIEMTEPDNLEDEFLTHINHAYAEDKMCLKIPEGHKMDKPIELFYFAHENTLVNGQVRIVLGKGAKALLIEHFESEAESFSNFQKKIVLEQASQLDHVIFQAEDKESRHYTYSDIETETLAGYNAFLLNNGGRKTRFEAVADISGVDSYVHISGVNLIDGDSHNDVTLHYNHLVENCSSRQHFKTVLADKATGVFQGKIFVDREAQKTDGYQLNNALILSDKAQMNSKPELEIYADDVKCSHGATTGELDADSLFYLRSRGLTKEQATGLLIEAFVGEAILDIAQDDIQEIVKGVASSWLGDHDDEI